MTRRLIRRREFEIAHLEYEQIAAKLKKLVEVDFVKLQHKLDKAGVPWTPGRQIPKPKK